MPIMENHNNDKKKCQVDSGGKQNVAKSPPSRLSAANKAPLDVQGRGRYSFRWCRRACFGLFLAGFGLFLANFRSLGGLGAHLDVRHWPLFAALRSPFEHPATPLPNGDAALVL